jgi:hypothetical protein
MFELDVSWKSPCVLRPLSQATLPFPFLSLPSRERLRLLALYTPIRREGVSLTFVAMPQIFSPFLLWALNVDIPVNIPNRFSIDASH